MTTKIDSIHPYEKNPRRIDDAAMEKLCASITRDPEFMRLRPIVVDAQGAILGGNQRWKACKKIGMKELPDGWVVRADDLTDEQRKRFVLIDNMEAGEWDFGVLQENWDAGELQSMGFDFPDEKENGGSETHEVTEEIRPISRVHILISMTPDAAAEAMPRIVEMAKAAGAEVHHAGN